MKSILINGLLLNNKYSGVQYSIEYFIQALGVSLSDKFKFTVLVSRDYTGQLKSTPNLVLSRVSFDSSNRFKRIFFENFNLLNFFQKNRFNLYHSPGYTLPYFAKFPTVVTIHDLIALDFPELCQTETAFYFSKVLPITINKATKIIAVSNTVKRDILNRFPQVDEGKIEVIYHGLHPRFKNVSNPTKLFTAKVKYNIPEKYLLFVGNLEPKKNLIRVLEAFFELKKDNIFEHKLVIAGKKGWKYSSIFHTIEASRWKNDIFFINYVDEGDLPSLYSMAELLLLPSLYEGFGLPVIEAMACGCPVLVSDRGALPEISGGDCPMVDPYNIHEIASCIFKVITNHDYRCDLIQKGYSRSESFKWKDAADKALKLYETIK